MRQPWTRGCSPSLMTPSRRSSCRKIPSPNAVTRDLQGQHGCAGTGLRPRQSREEAGKRSWPAGWEGIRVGQRWGRGLGTRGGGVQGVWGSTAPATLRSHAGSRGQSTHLIRGVRAHTLSESPGLRGPVAASRGVDAVAGSAHGRWGGSVTAGCVCTEQAHRRQCHGAWQGRLPLCGGASAGRAPPRAGSPQGGPRAGRRRPHARSGRRPALRAATAPTSLSWGRGDLFPGHRPCAALDLGPKAGW